MPSLASAAASLAHTGSAEAMAAVVATARGDVDAADVAVLAQVLADSGTKRQVEDDCADVASTGGPGSLSTLLSPLALRDTGLRVPKVAVPGRPAGGIDTLATLPGYRAALAAAEFEVVLQQCGYAHALAGADLAPLDAQLFAFRQSTGAQRVPALVVASLLSKKVAAGLRTVVLDVRVGPDGNFGADVEDARAASQLFVATAALLGIRAVCVLSDGASLRQPFVGRGEAIVATSLVVGWARQPGWLPDTAASAVRQHADECVSLASLARGPGGPTAGAGARLGEHLVAQGCSPNAFRARHDQVLSEEYLTVTAHADGYVDVDLTAVRNAVVSANAAVRPGSRALFPDAAGVTFLALPGAAVRRGDTVARVRGGSAVAHAIGVSAQPRQRAAWHLTEVS